MQSKYHPETNKGLILAYLQEQTEPRTSREIREAVATKMNASVVTNALNVLKSKRLIDFGPMKPSVSENGYKVMAPTYVIVK